MYKHLSQFIFMTEAHWDYFVQEMYFLNDCTFAPNLLSVHKMVEFVITFRTLILR